MEASVLAVSRRVWDTKKQVAAGAMGHDKWHGLSRRSLHSSKKDASIVSEGFDTNGRDRREAALKIHLTRDVHAFGGGPPVGGRAMRFARGEAFCMPA